MSVPGIRRKRIVESAMVAAPDSGSLQENVSADRIAIILVDNAGNKYSFLPTPLDNLTATTDPTVNDDSSEGYSVKSYWFNQVSEETFVLLDATVGAAKWVKTSLTVDELGSMALQDASAVAITGGTISGVTITGYQLEDATLTALAGLTIAANSLTIGTGPDAFSQVTFASNTLLARASTGDLEDKPISDYSIGALNYADAAAWRAGLALGSAAQSATTDFDPAGSAATAQASAIAAASADATTKANTAQANAATYTDTQLLAEGRRLFTLSLLGH